MPEWAAAWGHVIVQSLLMLRKGIAINVFALHIQQILPALR
jgi:hypothetical protein